MRCEEGWGREGKEGVEERQGAYPPSRNPGDANEMRSTYGKMTYVPTVRTLWEAMTYVPIPYVRSHAPWLTLTVSEQ